VHDLLQRLEARLDFRGVDVKALRAAAMEKKDAAWVSGGISTRGIGEGKTKITMV
jgi:hypothetical protein